MEFKYFDLTEIFRNRQEVEGGTGECVAVYDYTDFNMRWIEPPIPIYFISTLDEYGNSNVAPISLGTCCWGEHPWGRHYYTVGVQHSRNTNRNLKLNKECVISYVNAKQMVESTIACCPLPYGISEMDVAKLTPLPSKKVKPAGIKECVSNMEARVIDMVEVSNTTIFVCEIIAMSISEEALEKDRHTKYQLGIGGTDLVFEMSLNGNPPRMNYGLIDQSKILPCPSTIGDDKDWKGSFESWMSSELRRGRINKKEYKKLMELNKNWIRNSDPVANGDVKKELTDLLTEMIWRPIKGGNYVRKNDIQARKEHEEVRNSVGYYDFTHQLLEVTGSDAASFLDRMFVAGISKIKPQGAKYTTMLNKDGIIVDDVIVFRPDENRYWVSTLFIDKLMLRFDDRKREGEDVSYREITAEHTMYSVQGPNSRKVLNKMLKNDITDQKYFTICDNAIDDHPVKIARSGYTGELGYEIYCDPDDEFLVESKLEECGKEFNIQRITTDVTVTSLPKEKGFVLMNDLDRTNPLEVGFDWTIDWSKDFVGKDVLEKVKEEGAARTLLGFTIDDPNVSLPFETKVVKNGKVVGHITSYTYGYTVEKVIGYALIDKGAAEPGDAVIIHGSNATLTDRVFYDPENLRIRG